MGLMALRGRGVTGTELGHLGKQQILKEQLSLLGEECEDFGARLAAVKSSLCLLHSRVPLGKSLTLSVPVSLTV